MPNNFCNDNASVAYLAAALVCSLMFSSIALIYFSHEMGYELGIIPIMPIQKIESYSSEQNFKSGTFDLGTLARTGHTEWNYNEGVGLVLSQISGDLSTLYIMNINRDSNGKVTNYYTINNSVKKPYVIILEGNNGFSNNMLVVGDNGIYTTSHTIDGSIMGVMETFPYSNADKIEKVTIKTEYTRGLKNCPLFSTCTISKTPQLVLTFNGVTYTTTNLNIPESEDTGTAFFGGVAGINTAVLTYTWLTSIGLTLEEFKTDNIIIGSGEAQDPLTLIASTISALLAVATWQIPAGILPTELTVILIGGQETALIICIIVILRGGGI